jgi:hypothetical protein
MAKLENLELVMKFIESGVVPAAPCITPVDSCSVLMTLNKLAFSERRVVKRKFRKLWRKACRYMATHEPSVKWDTRCGFGIPANEIHSGHRYSRAVVVATFLRKSI